MEKQTIFDLNEIMTLLPHRPPFLFVDRVIRFKPHALIVAERTLLADEPWFVGHFPAMPVMPGVLVTDALAQTSGLLWGFTKKSDGVPTSDSPEIFFLAAVQMKYTNPAYPGDVLQLSAQVERNFGNLYTYTVEATAGRNLIAKGSLTLAMKGAAS